jgi:hypothetical protein
MQTQPIDGHPSLLSPHVLSSYHVQKLKHSVRAAEDEAFQKIQNITRLSHSYIANHLEMKREFRQLCSDTFTFVPDWNDPRIGNNTICVFTHREPTKEWKRMFISGVKRKYESIKICIRKAEDLQMPMEAHCDWVPSSE